MSTTAPARPSAASEAWVLLHELVASQRGRVMCISSEFDLAPGQMMALKWLDPETPVPMRELANAMSCDNSNVTGIIDRLEDRGLVERRPAAHDRRVKMLVVTPKGQELRRQIKERMEQAPPQLMRLSEAEQSALRDLLRKALDKPEP
jgi:DNA-binding MarR family transcriptional regulator